MWLRRVFACAVFGAATPFIPMLVTGESFADVVTPVQPLPADVVIVVQGEPRLRTAAPRIGDVFSAETLTRLGVDRLDDVAVAAPGLSMINDQDPGTNIVSMRGVTTDRLQQAAIAFVLDGVPLADTEFFTGPLFDLARIDVARGPQGALYGKSAAGGAVEISTRDALTKTGFASLAVGDGALREGEAAASFDVAPGWRVRASGRWSAADGWIRNRTLGRLVDAEESRALRLRAQGPALGGEIDAIVFSISEDGGAAWASSDNITGRFGGRLSRAALSDPIGDYEGRSERAWTQASVRYRAQLSQDVALMLLAARDGYTKRWDEELDYRPGGLTFFGAPLFPNGLQPIRQPTDIDATTLEARVTTTMRSDSARVDTLTFGAFAQDVDRARVDDFGPLLFGQNAAAYDTDSLQSAVYVGYALDGDGYQLDVQLRADADRRAQVVRDTVTGRVRDARRTTFTQWQPRVAGSVRLTDAAWIYGAYGEGFRSGGFNPLPSPTSVWRARFEPETTRSLEFGVKHDDGAFRAEAAVFAAAIDDYQNYTFLDGNSVTISVDRVDVRGAELTVDWRGVEIGGGALDAGLGLAYANATIARFTAPDPLNAGAVRDYSGKRVPNAPLWSGAARADWRTPLAADLELTLGATLNATGETVFEIDNVLRAPPKQWLDLRAGVRFGDTQLSLRARNATDERWAISAFGQGMLPLLAGLGPNGPFDTYTLNRGRQVQLELRREF